MSLLRCLFAAAAVSCAPAAPPAHDPPPPSATPVTSASVDAAPSASVPAPLAPFASAEPSATPAAVVPPAEGVASDAEVAKAKEVANSFLAAVSKRDRAGVKKLALAPDACDLPLPSTGEKKTTAEVATCKAELGKMPAELFDVYAKMVPAGFVAGEAQVTKAGPEVFLVQVAPAAGSPGSGATVVLVALGDKLSVALAKKVEKK